MRTDIAINGSNSPEAGFIGWVPVPSQVRLSDPTGATGPVGVRLRSTNGRQGGQVEFYPALPGVAQPELALTLPTDGAPVDFFVAGRFGRASTAPRDVTIEVVNAADNQILSRTPLMVRIRKDANTLTTAERNRFLSAFATLNDRGMGRFSDFRNVHTDAGSDEAHDFAGFLPWHRAFLLDLERELQRIDPSVALPYWRFDRPAPRLFTRDFMGVSDVNAVVRFSAANPLQFWATDGTPGIVRRPHFRTQTEPAQGPFGAVIDELATLALGLPGNRYARFRRMEGNPHGTAHVAFGGSISSIGTAAKDPLFFLLHANVDRLWARWQLANRRFDVTSTDSYTFLGNAASPGATRIGHNLEDTMWPWNQVVGDPRPLTAPGGTFPPSSLASAPGLTPTVRSMIDYQGVRTPASRLGFDYDDVPFQLP